MHIQKALQKSDKKKLQENDEDLINQKKNERQRI